MGIQAETAFLSFQSALEYVFQLAEKERLIHGMVGGTPQYLLQMDDRLSIEDNMKNTFLNPTSSLFEEVCKQYLWKLLLSGESLVEFQELGRWRGTDPSTRSQVEIDIMRVQDKDTALFGECKWTNEDVDSGILECEAGDIYRYDYL